MHLTSQQTNCFTFCSKWSHERHVLKGSRTDSSTSAFCALIYSSRPSCYGLSALLCSQQSISFNTIKHTSSSQTTFFPYVSQVQSAFELQKMHLINLVHYSTLKNHPNANKTALEYFKMALMCSSACHNLLRQPANFISCLFNVFCNQFQEFHL